MQNILGSIPHEFTNYWISKFPHLISHTYHAFSICSNEPIFKSYYNSSYHFTRPDYFEADDDMYPTLLQRDPKPLLKQQPQSATSSPKKSQTPLQARQRKGTYNFRKSSVDDEVPALSLQRNFDNPLPADSEEKRDVFANFKFRRYPKTSNRNNYNNPNNNKKDKHITWTLNATPATKDE